MLPNAVIIAVFLIVHNTLLDYSKSKGTLEWESCTSWGWISVLSERLSLLSNFILKTFVQAF